MKENCRATPNMSSEKKSDETSKSTIDLKVGQFLVRSILEWRDPLGLRGCSFFHIRNNKIAFQRGYWDRLSFLKQHGLPVE